MKTLTFNLSGKSIAQLRKEGCPIWSTWHEGNKFEKKTTKPRTIQVPKDFSLKGSENKSWKEQKKMLKEKGLTTLSANEIVEMLYLHYKKTGKWYNKYWLRSKTLDDGGARVNVGAYSDFGVKVNDWIDDPFSRVRVAASREIRKLKVEKLKSVPLSLEKRVKNLEKIVSKLTEVIKV